MTTKPRLLMPNLIAEIEAGDFRVANEVANLLCHDIAWIIHTMHRCEHEACRDELISAVREVVRDYCDGMKEGQQRLDAERAKEFMDAALARAIRRERGIDRQD